MNIEDIIYFAGLFDGEGTVTLTKRNSNEYRSPVITLTSTTKEIVYFCKSTFGGSVSDQKISKDHYKKSYVWGISSNRAINTMKLIIPYIKEPKKISRINYIINNYKKVTPRNGKYSQEMAIVKLNFEKEFFEIA